MNAIRSSRPNLQNLEHRRKVTQTKRLHRRHAQGAIVGETTAKLVVNVMLCAAAFTGLTKLWPYHSSQQTKLREVRAEVKLTEKRVKDLKEDFSRSFDPKQAKSVMQEQSYRVDPAQRQVVWQEPGIADEY
ncbi:MAG: hypothetical protein F6J92_27635 [Symploca sp. SIO1A3]|nr:hypothetical protein [Symploca sp. SIO2C1]NER50375.1 hypothetical protein [Symploca sp. SIO1A3]